MPRGGKVSVPVSGLARHWSEVVMLLSLVLVGLAWSLASAPVSAPDDDFHLASIWCVWGEQASGCVEGESVEGPAPRNVVIPPLSDHTSGCMAMQPDQSGACTYTDENSASGPSQFPTRANNGGYPGGFYAYLRLFVTGNTLFSLVMTRMASFLLSAGLVVATGWMLPRQDRDRAWLFLAFVLVPVGLFFMASTNPSGVAIAAVGATFAAARSALLEGAARRRNVLSAVAVVATLIATQSRPDAVWFCGLAVVAAFLSAEAWRGLSGRRLLEAVGPTLGLLAVVLVRSFGNLADYQPEPVGGDRPGLLFHNLANLTNLYVGDFATRLGWLDVTMPAAVTGVLTLAVGYVLTLGLLAATRGKALSFAAVGIVMIGYPLLLLTQYNSVIGENVQARYLMPLTVIAALSLSVGIPPLFRKRSAGVTLLMALAVALAHALALHTLIRRYVTGLDVQGWNLSAGAEWWWPMPIGPNLVWILGSGAFALLLILLAWRASSGMPTKALAHDGI